MIAYALMFYVFSAVLIASAVAVVASRNPVHSVLFLILAFFNAAGLFVLMGAEFVAMLLVIVYVGAVAVLFLFVVMMLNINLEEMKRGISEYGPAGLVTAAILGLEAVMLMSGGEFAPHGGGVSGRVSNTNALGDVLYTKYALSFLLSGLVLLVAMIGAIVLTYRPAKGVRKQSVPAQVSRKRSESVEIVKVESGKGVSWK